MNDWGEGQERERGRDVFERHAVTLHLVVSVLRRVPRSGLAILLDVFRDWPGLPGRALRYCLIRASALSCGEVVDIKAHVYVLGLATLELGSRISIHPFSYIDASGGLRIGDDVSIAHAVTILSTTHRTDRMAGHIRDQPVQSRPTTIESGVWIGAGARILAGVRVGQGSVVGAGAVVTKDVAAETIVAGVPARRVGERT